ncbi:MAG: sodium transporter, partial [Gammaproteobacteria bacterium]|nr:sodium transporter [Gammaproteobacteria bacterium]
PFIDRVGFVFLLCMAVGIGVSAIQGAEPHPDAIDHKDVDTSTTTGFNVAALVVVLMLAALYATWW